jgi:hypothetical protein
MSYTPKMGETGESERRENYDTTKEYLKWGFKFPECCDISEYWTMEHFQKPSDPKCQMSSSERFNINSIDSNQLINLPCFMVSSF